MRFLTFRISTAMQINVRFERLMYFEKNIYKTFKDLTRCILSLHERRGQFFSHAFIVLT